MDGQAPPATYEPKTIEMTLTVGSATSMTIDLYVKNDNSSYSKAIAIPFLEDGQDQADMRMPSPTIELTEGDTLILHLVNNNQLAHTFHLHGGLVPWEMDGVDYLTQHPVRQGEEFTYTFENLKAGTYWYHCHMDGAHHIDFGMYGAFIVKERDPPVKADREYVILLDEVDNCHVHGNTEPVDNQEVTSNFQDSYQCYYRFAMDYLAQNYVATTVGGITGSVQQGVGGADCPVLEQGLDAAGVPEPARSNILVMSGCAPAHSHGSTPPYETPRLWWFEQAPIYAPVYNTFLINGKAFPDSPVFPVKAGETVRFRLINAGNEMHFWHPHGHTMEVAYKDGYALPAPYKADTLAIGPGERYDYFIEANNPGLWAMHDQNGMAMMNDDKHPGGMMTCMPYDDFHDVDAFAMTRAIECNYAALRILGEHEHPM